MSSPDEERTIRALEETAKKTTEYTMFYDVFLIGLEEMIKEMGWIFVTEKQLELMEDSEFLNNVPCKDQPEVAIVLIYLLSEYNAVVDRKVATTTFPTSKHNRDTMKKHINTIDRFKEMLQDPHLVVTTPDDDFYKRLKQDTEALAKAMNKAMLMKYDIPNKKDIREFIYAICDEFNIKKGADVKAFINTFDKEN